MADTHVISALVKKRAELRGYIIHCKQLIATLDKDLQTIDATIKILMLIMVFLVLNQLSKVETDFLIMEKQRF